MVPFSMQNKKAADSLLTICYFTESKLLAKSLLSFPLKH
ncbi:hypothetical protein IIM_05144 [Bacillus cereus VD107]|nr:hypothetical protein IIM_05144 [Bacillus cereus VD107]